jgi:hypothetical protein
MPDPDKKPDANADSMADLMEIDEPTGEPMETENIEGIGLSDDVLYGDGLTLPSEDDKKPDEKKDEPKKPEDKKPDEKPKEDDPEKPKKPDAAEDRQREWDQRQQQRDQEHANERKALMAKVEELTAKVGELATRPASAQAKDDPADKDTEEDAEITEESTASDIAKAIQNDRKKTKALLDEIQSLKTQIGDMDKTHKAEKDASEQEKARVQAETAVKAQKADWDGHLTDCDKQYGEKFRADAIKAAGEYFASRGYTQQNLPPHEAAKARVELEYHRLAVKAGAKPAKEDPKPKLDKGTGGSPAQVLKGGTIDEVAEDMRKAGKFRRVGSS